jgi:hypothetical protein
MGMIGSYSRVERCLYALYPIFGVCSIANLRPSMTEMGHHPNGL